MSNLAELDAAVATTEEESGGSSSGSSGGPYRAYIQQNAESAYGNDRSAGGDLYDVSWAGPFGNSTVAKQASVVGLMVAAV
jgi:hypothetical protein